MFRLSEVAEKLASFPGVLSVEIPEASDLEAFYAEEGSVGSIADMPLENEAMEVSRSRRHHIILAVLDGFDSVPHHEVVMKDETGRTVGWDVPPGLEHEVEGRDDLIWMGEDFVIDPAAMEGEIRTVIVAQEMDLIGEEDGVKNPVVMYPSPSTDRMIRERYGIPDDPRYATAVVAFDEL